MTETVKELVGIYKVHYNEQDKPFKDDLIRFKVILDQILQAHEEELAAKDKEIRKIITDLSNGEYCGFSESTMIAMLIEDLQEILEK